MSFAKKLVAVFLVVFFIGLSSSKAIADDAFQNTFKTTLYGGLLGALLGSAVLLLNDNPEDHLSYIPTGAGIGMILGAVYGIATNAMEMRGAAEYEDGRFSLNMPTVKRSVEFDSRTNTRELVDTVDIVKVRF